MNKKTSLLVGLLLIIAFAAPGMSSSAGKIEQQKISTNKDKLLSIAVQGQIAPARPESSYITTWDGKPKMAIGIGGINYNLKIGDLVAIRDHYDYYGSGRYKGAVTIGVCIHGWSDFAGHGPGLNPVLSALPGRIETKIDPQANIAYYLGIKAKPAMKIAHELHE
jgi:hypothetical protein